MKNNAVYIIAEIGINHNGSIDLIDQMIDAAKWCGVDAVKFQKRTIELVYTDEELQRPRDSPFGHTNGDLKRGLELSKETYEWIHKKCWAVGLEWSCSVWDPHSVDFLMRFDPPWIKIPSALLTNEALLEKVSETKKPMIFSTGMSSEEEIERAIYFLDLPNSDLLTLLHCTSTYPCPDSELNLSYIRTNPWVDQGYPIGFSSHSVSPWPCVMAVCMGAEVIEAHFTLDRSMFGSDQAASLEPKAFKKMVDEIRTFERAKGDGVKHVYDSELPIREKLRR